MLRLRRPVLERRALKPRTSPDRNPRSAAARAAPAATLALPLARLWRREPPAASAPRLVRVAVEGRGGPDLLFIHGLAASPACWEDARARLDTPARAHLVHIRGFAGEPASPVRDPARFLKPLADELAQHLRAEARGPAAVVGHSMGGLAALMLARDHPDVVDRLMVVDVPAFFSVLISPFATGASIAGFAEVARRRYVDHDGDAFEEQLRRAAQTLVRHDIHRERVVHWGLTSDRAMTADVMAEVMVTDLRGDLKDVRAPVDVIYAWDRATPATRVGLDQIYQSTYAGLRGGRRLRIDDARHYVMLDQPGPFYAAMREWLARPAPAAR